MCHIVLMLPWIFQVDENWREECHDVALLASHTVYICICASLLVDSLWWCTIFRHILYIATTIIKQCWLSVSEWMFTAKSYWKEWWMMTFQSLSLFLMCFEILKERCSTASNNVMAVCKIFISQKPPHCLDLKIF